MLIKRTGELAAAAQPLTSQRLFSQGVIKPAAEWM
jgi:hypothetical protein